MVCILCRMDQIIRMKNTGRPSAFAYRLGISERTPYTYLNYLKGMGANISYNRHCSTYEYADNQGPSMCIENLFKI